MTTKRYINATGFKLTTVNRDTELSILHGGEIAGIYALDAHSARTLACGDGARLSPDSYTVIKPIRMVGGRYNDERKPTLQVAIRSESFTTYIFDEMLYSKLLEELAELR